MNIFTIHFSEALVIGLITGIMSGAFGIGGGTVCTPMLRLWLLMDPHVSIGTTMALIIPTAISGALNYVRKKLVSFKVGKLLIIPSVIGVFLGALGTTMVHGRILMLSFAALVAISGLDVSFGLIKNLIRKFYGDNLEAEVEEQKDTIAKVQTLDPAPSFVIIVGLLSGIMAGFFGVGGGFVLVPCFMYCLKMPIKSAFGTSLLVVAALSIPGTITHAAVGHVDPSLLIAMMLGSIPGSLLGSSLAIRLKDSLLRKAFGILMLIVAGLMAFNELS